MLVSNNCTINNKDGVLYITFPIFEKTNKLKHCFSTRIGGVSKGKYSQMNLSYKNGDSVEAVNENYKIICSCIDVSTDSLVHTKQTHTVNIIRVDSNSQIIPPDTDGIMTNKKGITICSSYADCVPLLFFDPTHGAIAISHSGWRGTVGEIGRLTVEKMNKEYGTNPQELLAVIGPAICQKCYEVDNTVIEKINNIHNINKDKAYYSKPNGKYMLNLKEVCRQTLLHSGLKEENLLVSDICTACNSEYLHSHRATNGERGTLCALLALK